MKMVRHNPYINKSGRLFINVIKAVVKGFATGAGFAGIINTIAPGILPTFCGYLVGKGFSDILVQCGLITLGVFSRPSVNAVAVLVLVGVIFGFFYGVVTLTLVCSKGVRSRRRKKYKL